MGAALLGDSERLADLVGGIVDGTDLPVSVKIRRGGGIVGYCDDGTVASRGVNVQEVVAAVVNSGASAVTIHGRTRTDRYTQMADWRDIAAGAVQAQTARPLNSHRFCHGCISVDWAEYVRRLQRSKLVRRLGSGGA